MVTKNTEVQYDTEDIISRLHSIGKLGDELEKRLKKRAEEQGTPCVWQVLDEEDTDELECELDGALVAVKEYMREYLYNEEVPRYRVFDTAQEMENNIKRLKEDVTEDFENEKKKFEAAIRDIEACDYL